MGSRNRHGICISRGAIVTVKVIVVVVVSVVVVVIVLLIAVVLVMVIGIVTQRVHVPHYCMLGRYFKPQVCPI